MFFSKKDKSGYICPPKKGEILIMFYLNGPIDIFNYMTYAEAFGTETKKEFILPLLPKLFRKSGKFSKVRNSNTNSFDAGVLNIFNEFEFPTFTIKVFVDGELKYFQQYTEPNHMLLMWKVRLYKLGYT